MSKRAVLFDKLSMCLTSTPIFWAAKSSSAEGKYSQLRKKNNSPSTLHNFWQSDFVVCYRSWLIKWQDIIKLYSYKNSSAPVISKLCLQLLHLDPSEWTVYPGLTTVISQTGFKFCSLLSQPLVFLNPEKRYLVAMITVCWSIDYKTNKGFPMPCSEQTSEVDIDLHPAVCFANWKTIDEFLTSGG